MLGLWHINFGWLFDVKSNFYTHNFLTHLVDTFLTSLTSLFCTQLNGFKYFYQTQIILFTINHLFAHSLNVKQFYWTLSGATTLGQSGPRSDGNEGYSVFSKVQAKWDTHHQIALCHTQDTWWGDSYPSAEMQSMYSAAPTQPNWLALNQHFKH